MRNMRRSVLLKFASCTNLETSICEIFGADTQGAGFSQSARGEIQSAGETDHLFAADAVRDSDNTSPSLTLERLDGKHLFDSGNISLLGLSFEEQINAVAESFLKAYNAGRASVCLGGDHLIKYAAFKAFAKIAPECAFLYIDAHPDALPTPIVNFSSILHHAVKTEGIKPERIAILGLRQMNLEERSGLESLGLRSISARTFNNEGAVAAYHTLKGWFADYKSLYISVDLDAFHNSEAPAVEAPYPGGIFFSPTIELVHLLATDFKFIGLDISEFLPRYDDSHVTALLAAAIAKEFYALVFRQK